ncbi:MAG: HEAT repeat domain-containing protein [Planctomycetes bacterium]|nr:HEAT repeat domain-containing protein [Planctomycetota bacterium]
MRHAAAAFLVLIACAASSRADEPAEPRYADKPASWWVEELIAGDNPEAAGSVLRKMGDNAAPSVAARLPTTRAARDRIALLSLLGAMKVVPASVAPHLQVCLRSDDAAEQRAALKVTERVATGAAGLASDIAALLGSSAPDVRASAATALGAMGAAAVPHVDALVACIDDADPRVPLAAVTALGRIGPPAAAALPDLLSIAVPRPQQAALLYALVAIGPDDERVADAFVRAADSSDEQTRATVSHFLSRVTPVAGAVQAAAIRLVKHGDAKCRSAAAQALGRHGTQHGRFADELYVLLGDSDVGVVGAATEAMLPRGEGPRPSAERVVAVWRSSKFPMAFTQLLKSLGAEVGTALFEAAASDNDELRGSAWHIIQRTQSGSLTADADSLTRVLLDHRIIADRRFGLFSLVVNQGAMVGEPLRLVLNAVVREGDPKSAALAVPLLSKGPDRLGPLLAASARPEPEVRAAALAAMANLLAADATVRDATVRALDDPDEAVRATALRVLSGHRGPAWDTASAARDALLARLPALVGVGPEERRSVLSIAASIPEAARPLPLLVSMLAFDDCAESVIDILGARGASILPRPADPDPAALLTPLLDGEDLVLAARAARVLAMRRRTAPGIVERLPAWIESSDPRVARAALLAANDLVNADIARIGGSLVRAARAGVEGVAWPACSALSRIANDEPVARDALLAVADDPKNSGQIAVIQFLASFGDPGITRIVAFLDHQNRDARRSACIALLPIARRDGGNREVLVSATPSLDRLAASDDLEVARLAKDVLTAIRR